MILDASLLFDSLSTFTATTASVNVIDLGVNRDIGVGVGNPLKILCLVGTAFTATNAATLTVQIQGSTDNSTYVTLIQSTAIATTALTANTKIFEADMPRNKFTRYLRMNYVVATGALAAGTITAALVLTRDDFPYYPPGIAIAN